MRGSQVTLEKNPTYWEKGLPYLDRIVVRDLAGSVVGLQRLLTGEIDYVGELTPSDVRATGTPNRHRAGADQGGSLVFPAVARERGAVRQCEASSGVRSCDRSRADQ